MAERLTLGAARTTRVCLEVIAWGHRFQMEGVDAGTFMTAVVEMARGEGPERQKPRGAMGTDALPVDREHSVAIRKPSSGPDPAVGGRSTERYVLRPPTEIYCTLVDFHPVSIITNMQVRRLFVKFEPEWRRTHKRSSGGPCRGTPSTPDPT